MKFFVGGCAYRSQVHVAHMASVVDLISSQGKYSQFEMSYRNTSNLPQGRSLWLRDAIDSGSDIAISIDSDTGFSARDITYEIHAVMGVAISIAPVIRRAMDGIKLNVYLSNGEAMSPSDAKFCGDVVRGGASPLRQRLWAGGFGLVAFNLKWFRSNWPRPQPEQISELDYIDQGEDIQMCRSVAKRGGAIVPMWVGTRHYDMTGEQSIGAAEIYYEDGAMKAR